MAKLFVKMDLTFELGNDQIFPNFGNDFDPYYQHQNSKKNNIPQQNNIIDLEKNNKTNTTAPSTSPKKKISTTYKEKEPFFVSMQNGGMKLSFDMEKILLFLFIILVILCFVNLTMYFDIRSSLNTIKILHLARAH